MTLRRRAIDWSLAGLLLLLPALILRSSLKTGELSVFDKAVLRVSSPLEGAVTWVVEGVGGVWSRYVALVGVEDENRELRGQNDELRKQLAQTARRAYDAEALEQLVDLKKRSEAELRAARVISESTTPYFRVVRIRIDRGAPEIAKEMPVVTAEGLVGHVGNVYGDHADVVLVSDPGSNVAITIPNAGVSGMVRGLGKDDSYACTLSLLEGDHDASKIAVHEGDKVITSGAAEAYPAGIVVGTVSAVRKGHSFQQEIEVEPAVRFSDLHAVMVVVAVPPPPDPAADVKRKSEPAFGTRAP
jgi:rod shape-determining protein MreC